MKRTLSGPARTLVVGIVEMASISAIERTILGINVQILLQVTNFGESSLTFTPVKFEHLITCKKLLLRLVTMI